MIFLQYGQIDVIDGAFVLIDKTGIRTHIFLLARLPASCWSLVHGFRMQLYAWLRKLEHYWYGWGKRVFVFMLLVSLGGARSDKLLYQAKLAPG
ncbi:putative CRISPR-associated protein Cas1 [Escherichia coli]|uniref:Putative CRISPR-associated protein Cas1 n=1 Tax=Escherichia coli TaxID=562 RepID=A0A2X1KN88_ECOLX|nr:putative CRISPR-associated protein Cas1 [Escherichia coli]